ncbi:MAG: YitT family protein [Clostridia bacterium]|nr:YitT family protein [Clostridia bacterium]
MKTGKFFKSLLDYLILFLASVICAIALYNFAVAFNFPLTGFSGLAMILNYLFGLPMGITNIALNIPVAILCYKRIGKKFFWRSVFCTLVYSLATDYLAPLLPVYKGSMMLSALSSGVLGGFGYAIIYMRNASTGGTDFVSVYIKAIFPHISLGKILFFVDGLIVVAGGLIMQDVDGIMYGLIISYVTNTVIDKMMFGVNAGKLALVITEKGAEVAKAIDEVTERGATLVDVKGAYKMEPKQMVLCACNNKQMFLIETAIKKVDENAFTIILESNEVHGEGFDVTRIAG